MLGTILIFIYLLASILVGIWASRKETPEGFLLGDRKVGTLSTFATIAASKTGGGLFLTLVALTYMYGVGVIGYVAGLVVSFIVFYFFDIKPVIMGFAVASTVVGLLMGGIVSKIAKKKQLISNI